MHLPLLRQTCTTVFVFHLQTTPNPYLSAVVTMEPTAPAASSFDVSVTATLQRFRSYPNVTKAKLICAAAEFEQVDQPNATPIYRSPKRVALMGELQHINELATRLQQPSLKSELGQIAACQYLDSK